MIGVLSDAHGNGLAFRHAIDLLRGRGARRFLFLGDAVGYLPDWSVVEALRAMVAAGDDVLCLQGNHEAMLLSGATAEPPREAVYQLAPLRQTAPAAATDVLAAWPASHREVLRDGTRVLFVHGSPADATYGYVYPDTDLAPFAPQADMVFMGHTHRPFIREHAGVRYINVGSCGLPRDDGRYGAAALLDPQGGGVEILRFDITAQTRSSPVIDRVHPAVQEVLARREQGE